MFQVLVRNGHRIDDVKDTYTMSQVYLFFEKCKKIDLDKDKMNAIVFANCLLGTSDSNDASEARRKNTAFSDFMDSLSWDSFVEKVEEKEKPKTAEATMKQLCGGVGIVPFRNRQK